MVDGVPSAFDGVWRLHPQARLVWRDWGDGWTVFDDGSGQTHWMDQLTAMAVMALEAGAASIEELVFQLAGDVKHTTDSGLPATLRPVLQDTFARLAAADLIEPMRA